MRRVLYCLLPLAAASAMPAQAQSGGSWRVSEVSGTVTINEGGRTRAATRGTLLSGGSVIAAARSRAVLVRGKQYVMVSPGSTLRIPVSGAAGGGVASVVEMVLEGGNALFKVDRRETPHFRVQTRYLAAVVRGTTFSVTVTDTGGSVQVTEGAVQVSTLDGGASDLIRPGMIAHISASDVYKLTISGDQERVIRSPNAPAGTVTTPAAPPVAGAASGGLSLGIGPARVTAPVGESPVRLADATGGLLSGAPAITLAMRDRGDDAADRNRGSGNDRDDGDTGSVGRSDQAGNSRDMERDDRDGRGNGTRLDEDKDSGRPGNGNDGEGPAGDKGGKDRPDNGNGGDGSDDDQDDKDRPGNGNGGDGSDEDKDDKNRPGNGNGGEGSDDDKDDKDPPGNGGGNGPDGDKDDKDPPGNGNGGDPGKGDGPPAPTPPANDPGKGNGPPEPPPPADDPAKGPVDSPVDGPPVDDPDKGPAEPPAGDPPADDPGNGKGSPEDPPAKDRDDPPGGGKR